jgi:hypothetical protein
LIGRVYPPSLEGYYTVCGGLGVDTPLRNELHRHHQSPAGLTLLFHPHSRSEPRLSAPAGPTRHKDEATSGGRCDLSCNGDALARHMEIGLIAGGNGD